ncbi:unnamed protein product [Bursaphelenchus okinawaensis]|uniref:CHK kinase-like domain-containing protein n=1 Tax=Bursaphelenchus okinawaensis TaxID=465554 RepID=A0A811K1T7_9BILA|nr:unnamed protein product [Bursaphelenchus okinawaensis]CAG9089708.1 unnamed protein product [Bursaphelenchus okinawaensis]
MGKNLSEDYALSLIRKWDGFRNLENKSKVKEVSVQPLSIDELGYLSIVYSAKVTFEDGSTFPYIIKTPCIDRFTGTMDDEKGFSDMDEFLFTCHNRECKMYQILSSIDVKVPKLFASKEATLQDKNGYLVMESFIDKATIMSPVSQITPKQILSVASNLGKIRAELEKLDQNQWNELNDTFRLDRDLVGEMMEPNIEKLLKYDHDTFYPLCRKLKPYSGQNFFEYVLQTRAKDLGVEWLVHSDLHGGNLMFKNNPDGSISPELATIIDWQSGFSGNSLFDLARFACISADADIRRGCEEEAVNSYYDSYIKHSKNPNPKFTREVCQELYELGVILEGVEWQIIFAFFGNNPPGNNEGQIEAIRAKMALRARLGMEDALSLIEKHNCKQIVDKLPSKVFL